VGTSQTGWIRWDVTDLFRSWEQRPTDEFSIVVRTAWQSFRKPVFEWSFAATGSRAPRLALSPSSCS